MNNVRSHSDHIQIHFAEKMYIFCQICYFLSRQTDHHAGSGLKSGTPDAAQGGFAGRERGGFRMDGAEKFRGGAFDAQ